MRGWIGRLVASSTGVALLHASVATAQPAPEKETNPEWDLLAAPRSAFEIGVGAGYTQPVGYLSANEQIGDVVDAGGGFTLDLGYRINPSWGVAWNLQFHESNEDDTFIDEMQIRGLVTGLSATFHALPYAGVDPYLTLGGGYRLLWLVSDEIPSRLLHGPEVAKVVLGIDFRLSDSVAIGPALGADVNVFLWSDSDDPAASGAIDDPRPAAFLFAAFTGRFDIGGMRETIAREIVENDRIVGTLSAR